MYITPHSHVTFSAVLVLTDLTTLGRLGSNEPSWKPMAIDYANAHDIDQLAFYCKESEAITHVALLDEHEPWVPVLISGRPATFRPNIVEVMDMIDPVILPYSAVQAMQSMDCSPEHNIEGVIIEDLDDLLADDTILPSLIQDGYILNRRNVNFVAALSYLLADGLDAAALAEEFTEVSEGLRGEQLEELPTNWAKGWKQSEEEQQALLSLLNSAFDSYMAVE